MGNLNVHEAEIRHRLTNHPPDSPRVGVVLDELTDTLIYTGMRLAALLPESREKSLAITKLEECSMWSKAAVARNQGDVT